MVENASSDNKISDNITSINTANVNKETEMTSE